MCRAAQAVAMVAPVLLAMVGWSGGSGGVGVDYIGGVMLFDWRRFSRVVAHFRFKVDEMI